MHISEESRSDKILAPAARRTHKSARRFRLRLNAGALWHFVEEVVHGVEACLQYYFA